MRHHAAVGDQDAASAGSASVAFTAAPVAVRKTAVVEELR